MVASQYLPAGLGVSQRDDHLSRQIWSLRGVHGWAGEPTGCRPLVFHAQGQTGPDLLGKVRSRTQLMDDWNLRKPLGHCVSLMLHNSQQQLQQHIMIYHLVMTNSSPWKITIFNRWTIYFYGPWLYHGYWIWPCRQQPRSPTQWILMLLLLLLGRLGEILTLWRVMLSCV